MGTLQQAIDALNAAATAYNGKIASIDAKVAQAQTDFNTLTPGRWIEDTITIGGDVNYLYPVWWNFSTTYNDGVAQIEIGRSWNENSGQPVSNQIGSKDGSHIYSLLLQLEGNSTRLWADANFMQIKRFNEVYDVGCSHVAWQMHIDPATSIGPVSAFFSGCYLRGGGLTYHIRRNKNIIINYQDGTLGIGGVTNIRIGENVTPIYMGLKDAVTGLYPNIQTPATVINPGLVAV